LETFLSLSTITCFVNLCKDKRYVNTEYQMLYIIQCYMLYALVLNDYDLFEIKLCVIQGFYDLVGLSNIQNELQIFYYSFKYFILYKNCNYSKSHKHLVVYLVQCKMPLHPLLLSRYLLTDSPLVSGKYKWVL